MNSNVVQQKKIEKKDIIFIIVTFLMFCASTFLFYMQSIKFNDGYNSDTYLYINMFKEQHGTRLITWIYSCLYKIGNDTIPIAIYMGIVIVGIILMNYLLMKLYHRNDDFSIETSVPYECFAILLLFTGSMYIPFVHEFFYKSSWCTFAWHSPTQHLMILCALISLYFFEKVYDNYMEYIRPMYWIALMIASTVSVWAKPSFMLVLIPTIIIVFIIELIQHIREKNLARRFVRLCIVGFSMVPAGILILILNNSIYGEESQNSVEMGLSHLLNINYNVGIAIICGLLCPIIVYIANYKRLKETRFQIALGMLLTGILEWAIFYEVGTRGEHGNFGWGRQFGCYYFFLTAMVITVENYQDESFLKGDKQKRILYFVVISATMFIHIVSQLYHFYLMLRGHSYYI